MDAAAIQATSPLNHGLRVFPKMGHTANLELEGEGVVLVADPLQSPPRRLTNPSPSLVFFDGWQPKEYHTVFDLKWLFPNRKGADATSTEETLKANDEVMLLAITHEEKDQEALRQIADGFGWKISIADSSERAIALLLRHPVPLVICDRDLPGEDWREALARIASLPQSICVLLASGVVDEYLWNEVVQNHGYDIVGKPFRKDDVKRAVTFARSWSGWASGRGAEAGTK